jgi:hypothetical protein
MRKKEINEANDHGHISEKTGPFSGWASGRSLEGIPEEGTVVLGDCYMLVTAPKVLPVGQDVEVEDNDIEVLTRG